MLKAFMSCRTAENCKGFGADRNQLQMLLLLLLPPLQLVLSVFQIAAGSAVATAIRCRSCPHCGKVFSSMCGYRIHVNKHRGIYPFQCEVCNRGFTTKRTLSEHMRHHTNVNYFSCMHCNHTFPTEYKMKTHMSRVHPGQWWTFKDL